MNKNKKKKLFYRINEQIKAKQVRLVGENVTNGIYPIEKALEIAVVAEMDLVEISNKKLPPICKLMIYEKFLYQQKRKLKETEKKKRENRIEVKEIRFTSTTDTHDFEFKLRHAKKFINDGNRVKATVMFKGRSIMFKDQGTEILCRLADNLEDVAIAEKMPAMEGKRMIMFLKPKKNK